LEKDLTKIFNSLKEILIKYENPLVAKFNLEGRYELYSLKDVIIEGRKKKEVFFAGLITQKSYVGFYYMPVYINTELKAMFKPELLKLLKGKSCFHIKSLDSEIEMQIAEALDKGYMMYKERGWL
jgi:hypothetical protein